MRRDLPLAGRRFVVTRAEAQTHDFVQALEALGGMVVCFPLIRITDPADPQRVAEVAREVHEFDWIVFTSANGVSRFWQALRSVGSDTGSLAGVSVCAIGPATAAAIEREGARADLVPDRYVAEGVVEALARAADLRGARILLPRAEVARDVLPIGLRDRGADVVDVPVYRTVPDRTSVGELSELLSRRAVDLITFTSSSAVRNFAEAFGTELHCASVGSIGPVTTATALKLGIPVHLEAQSATVAGFVQAIRDHYVELAQPK